MADYQSIEDELRALEADFDRRGLPGVALVRALRKTVAAKEQALLGQCVKNARLAQDWKRMAELQYGRLRVALYGDKELGYPVEGALDALFERMVKGEWPK